MENLWDFHDAMSLDFEATFCLQHMVQLTGFESKIFPPVESRTEQIVILVGIGTVTVLKNMLQNLEVLQKEAKTLSKRSSVRYTG